MRGGGSGEDFDYILCVSLTMQISTFKLFIKAVKTKNMSLNVQINNSLNNIEKITTILQTKFN
jgi:hypothetical protein